MHQVRLSPPLGHDVVGYLPNLAVGVRLQAIVLGILLPDPWNIWRWVRWLTTKTFRIQSVVQRVQLPPIEVDLMADRRSFIFVSHKIIINLLSLSYFIKPHWRGVTCYILRCRRGGAKDRPRTNGWLADGPFLTSSWTWKHQTWKT